jgi:transposase
VKRGYPRLKNHLLPKSIYVKGYVKVSVVLMLAVLCLTALKYLRYFPRRVLQLALLLAKYENKPDLG